VKSKGSDLGNIILLSCGPGSVVGMATGYELDGPGIESRWGARFSAPVQTDPGAHPASCTIGTGSFPGVKSGRCVTLTPHPLLVPWLWKSRAIPLLPLWAVRPVQSLSACTRVHFTFTLLNHVVLVNQWRFKSTHSQHQNAARSFIYPPTACFGRSIRPSSGRQHKYINRKVCCGTSLSFTTNLIKCIV